MSHSLDYIAPPTVAAFIRSTADFKALLGPIGGGKSVGCVMNILRACAQQRVGKDGFRRSRWAVVRNTKQQLKDTTIKTWMDWIPAGIFGKWKESEMTFFLEFNDVRAEILFRALDKPDDVARVLSLELTGCWLNECREIPQEIVEGLQGRLERYPSKTMGGSNYWSLIADTNPPEEESYWYKIFEGLPLEEDNPDTVVQCDTYKQPSGLSPEAENLENLEEGYYSRKAKGRSTSWIDVYLKAQYALSQSGKPVYHGSFKPERHVSKAKLKIDPDLPVVVGLDFGLTPAAVFKQMQMDGRIFTLRELPAFDMGIKRFIKTKLRPLIMTTFPTNPLIFIGDPAGSRRSDTDEGTCFKELKDAFKQEGARVKPASTNDPVVRIQATETLFTTYPDGEPLGLIDPSCKFLIDAYRSKYRYPKRKATGDFGDKPEKNQWSHAVEAGQYADLFLTGGKYDPSDYSRFENDQFFNLQRGYRPAQAEGY